MVYSATRSLTFLWAPITFLNVKRFVIPGLPLLPLLVICCAICCTPSFYNIRRVYLLTFFHLQQAAGELGGYLHNNQRFLSSHLFKYISHRSGHISTFFLFILLHLMKIALHHAPIKVLQTFRTLTLAKLSNFIAHFRSDWLRHQQTLSLTSEGLPNLDIPTLRYKFSPIFSDLV